MTEAGWEGSDHTRGRGAAAERFAAAWLAGQGYRILATNAETIGGELDIVAQHDDTLVFVEVKARQSSDHGPAIAAVGRDKQRRVIRAAQGWLVEKGWQGACRFDVIGLERAGSGWDVCHIENAFEVEPGR